MAWGTFLLAPSDQAMLELAKMDPVYEKAMNALESLSAKPDVQEIARERELALLTYKLEIGEAKAEGRAEGRAEAEVRVRVQALLAILAGRRLELSEALRSQILSCADTAILDRWIHQAVTAQTAAEAIS